MDLRPLAWNSATPRVFDGLLLKIEDRKDIQGTMNCVWMGFLRLESIDFWVYWLEIDRRAIGDRQNCASNGSQHCLLRRRTMREVGPHVWAVQQKYALPPSGP